MQRGLGPVLVFPRRPIEYPRVERDVVSAWIPYELAMPRIAAVLITDLKIFDRVPRVGLDLYSTLGVPPIYRVVHSPGVLGIR